VEQGLRRLTGVDAVERDSATFVVSPHTLHKRGMIVYVKVFPLALLGQKVGKIGLHVLQKFEHGSVFHAAFTQKSPLVLIGPLGKPWEKT
jgi:hypothetical protein